jgi:hypothetical protein
VDAGPFIGRGPGENGADIHIRLPINFRLGIISVVMLGAFVSGTIIIMTMRSVMILKSEYIGVLTVAMFLCIAGLFLFFKSNMALYFFQKNADSLFKRLIRDNKLTLNAGERVERIALFKIPMCLLVFTNKNMMICGVGLMGTDITGIEAIPYSDISAANLVGKRFMMDIGIDLVFFHKGTERKVSFRHFSKPYCTALADEIIRRAGLVSRI